MRMTFEDFVSVHKDDTPMQKLNQLMATADLYFHNRIQATTCMRNYNYEDAMYFHGETDQMDKRMRWLYDELKVALGGAK